MLKLYTDSGEAGLKVYVDVVLAPLTVAASTQLPPVPAPCVARTCLL
jgi:hypothetical protein